MEQKESSMEDVRRAIVLQNLKHTMDIIVQEYTNPIHMSTQDARQDIRKYAVMQRDYWDNSPPGPNTTALRQVWTDALVYAGAENNWNVMKEAVRFDIENFQNLQTARGQQLAAAFSNLTHLL